MINPSNDKLSNRDVSLNVPIVGDNILKLVEARTLKGFRDLLPAEAGLKSHMLHSLEDVFRKFGFPRIETPHLEYAECLLGDAGAEISKQVYRFKDNGDRDVALRFDLTVPFARYVVQHQAELGLPFRRYAIGNVFRGEKSQAGRYREFTQCDFDIIGSESFDAARAADAETVQVMVASLKALKVPGFSVCINNRKIYNGLCEYLGVADNASNILRAIDKIGKIGAEGITTELKPTGISEQVISELLEFVNLSKGKTSLETLASLEKYRNKSQMLDAGIDELSAVVKMLSAIPSLDSTHKVDLSIARGLGYYTGIVFETMVRGYENFGSVCSGGRYDNLATTFSKKRLPGVGASVGLDRLMAVLSEIDKTPVKGTPAELLIFIENSDSIGTIHAAAAQLRELGLNVETYPQVGSIKDQFKYAERHGHPFTLRFMGNNNWQISNLEKGTKEEISNLEQVSLRIKTL